MPLLKSDVWPAVLEAIQKDVGEQRFSLWFRNVRPVRLEGDTAVLGVPNLFVQEWLETHFLDILRRCLTERLGRPATVKFVIDAALFKQAREAELRAGAVIVEEASAAAKEPERLQAQIRPDFTFANFVVGSGNKLAYACAMEILDSSSNRLNPLFIHSLSGLGRRTCSRRYSTKCGVATTTAAPSISRLRPSRTSSSTPCATTASTPSATAIATWTSC